MIFDWNKLEPGTRVPSTSRGFLTTPYSEVEPIHREAVASLRRGYMLIWTPSAGYKTLPIAEMDAHIREILNTSTEPYIVWGRGTKE